jgi:hypothetical protein
MNVSAYGIPGILLKQHLKSNGLKKTNGTKTIPVKNRIMIFVNLIHNCEKTRGDPRIFCSKFYGLGQQQAWLACTNFLCSEMGSRFGICRVDVNR